MRPKLMIGFISVLLAFGVLQAQIGDPIFGISYDPQKVHFEEAPALIGKICSDLRGMNLPLYAHWKSHDTEYYIMLKKGSEFGTAIGIKGTKCNKVDSDRFLAEGTNTLAEGGPVKSRSEDQEVMDGIATDILGRYSKAFGGKQLFLKALGDNYNGMPLVLRRKLELYKK